MREAFTVAGVFALMIGIVFGVGWLVTGGNLLWYQFWAPKYAAVQRDVYEHTLSYQKGSADRLAALCNQISAGGDRLMLQQQINQEFSSTSMSDMPDYLQGCLLAARGN